jgi:hypothetical protein
MEGHEHDFVVPRRDPPPDTLVVDCNWEPSSDPDRIGASKLRTMKAIYGIESSRRSRVTRIEERLSLVWSEDSLALKSNFEFSPRKIDSRAAS